MNNNNADILKTELDMKKTELFDLIENKINGIMIRSKAEYIESNEKKIKTVIKFRNKRDLKAK